MTALLRAEIIKLRTTRTFLALAGTALFISVALTALTAILGDPTRDSVLVEVFASDVSSLFILILATVGIGGEWRHHTITSSLLAAPDRDRFLLAKVLAFAVAGALLSLLVAVLDAVVGYAILAYRDLPVPSAGEVLGLAARSALVSALLGALGVTIGALTRNLVVAIVGLLLFLFVVEPTVIGFFPEVGRFGPFTGLATPIGGIPPEDAGLGDVDLLAPVPAFGAMMIWIAVTFGGAAGMMRRRDLD